MLENLLTERPNPASAAIDTLPSQDVVRIINSEDQKVALAVQREIPAIARAVDAVVAALQNGGRLFYIGAGTSGRLGVLDASEIPPTYSAPPEMVQGIMAGGEAALSRATETTEDDPAIGVRDLVERGFTARDVLVGLAASGRTPYVLGAVAGRSGSYVNETNYFEKDWQRAFWGDNYSRLAEIKQKYDPDGLFFVHNGVGSERWSSDGFTRL